MSKYYPRTPAFQNLWISTIFNLLLQNSTTWRLKRERIDSQRSIYQKGNGPDESVFPMNTLHLVSNISHGNHLILSTGDLVIRRILINNVSYLQLEKSVRHLHDFLTLPVSRKKIQDSLMSFIFSQASVSNLSMENEWFVSIS